MKRNIVFLLIGICCFSATLFAQTKDEKDVAAAVESLRLAMVDPNKKSLEDLCADQLTYGHSSGKLDTKASFIEDLVTGKSDFVSIKLVDQTINISDNVALVRHKLMGESIADGKTSPINLYVLLVWQKQKGQWKFLARQAARINP